MPSDVLVPSSVTGTDKATMAHDITITDRTNKTALDRGIDRKPLAEAAVRSSWGHTRKHARRQGAKVSPS